MNYVNRFSCEFDHHKPKLKNCEDSQWHQSNGSAKHILSCLPKEYPLLPCGSSDLRRNYVYPSTLCPQQAFLSPVQCSPKSTMSHEFSTSLPQCSPSLSCQDTSQISQLTSKMNDITFSTLPANDVDEVVAKINLMFPTVPEHHIRMLLKKYFNREALVISALQVEKHPMTTPSPYATPPPITRNFSNIAMGINTPVFRCNSRTTGGSTITRPGSMFSHYADSSTYYNYNNTYRPSTQTDFSSSPRLKLRYLKSQFPEADVNIILDLLYNNDKNVQKVSEDLISMGFKRKAKTVPKIVVKEVINETDKMLKSKIKSRLKTFEEKSKIRSDLQEQYKSIPNPILAIALESVNYNDDRARQILDIMLQEELESKQLLEEGDENQNGEQEASSHSQHDEIADVLLDGVGDDTVDNGISVIKSQRDSMLIDRERNKNLVTWKQNDNQSIAQGPNSNLLLKKYIKWAGPDKSNVIQDIDKLANGPNSTFRCQNNANQSIGSNKDLRKGPVCGLAKGSIYSFVKDLNSTYFRN